MTAGAITALPPLLARPERQWVAQTPLERGWTAIVATLRARAIEGRAARLTPVLEAVDRHGSGMRGFSDAALRVAAREAGAALRADPNQAVETVARVLAPVCEVAARVLGQRPYPPQVLAAYACTRGMLVEMATGEGKTLAAGLAAATIALSGTPVHVLTVNRYLAERDAAFSGPFYGFFGLRCGLVTEAVRPDERRAAYRCPIAVAVNKDIAFDYMRDRLAFGRPGSNARRKVAALREDGAGAPLLCGLHHAIIDEADSVLIDEARTPLILSTGGDSDRRSASVFDRALEIASRLRPDVDYVRIEGERRVVLLPPGRLAVEALSARWTVEGAGETHEGVNVMGRAGPPSTTCGAGEDKEPMQVGVAARRWIGLDLLPTARRSNRCPINHPTTRPPPAQRLPDFWCLLN